MEDELYQFIVSDYAATGEGRTVSILITRAYPHVDDYATKGYVDENGFFVSGKLKEGYSPKVIAAREFIEEFGGWYAQGAENLSRVEFLKRYKHFLPEFAIKMLNDPDQPGNFNFRQQFHFNYS